MNTAELLARTADRLDSHGWTQGRMGMEAGPNCLVGAMIQVIGEPCSYVGPPSRGARRPIERACAEFVRYLDQHRGQRIQCPPLVGCPCCDGSDKVTAVMRWNDMSQNTRSQVTFALRDCARRLRPAAAFSVRLKDEAPTYVPPQWVTEQMKPTITVDYVQKALALVP